MKNNTTKRRSKKTPQYQKVAAKNKLTKKGHGRPVKAFSALNYFVLLTILARTLATSIIQSAQLK